MNAETMLLLVLLLAVSVSHQTVPASGVSEMPLAEASTATSDQSPQEIQLWPLLTVFNDAEAATATTRLADFIEQQATLGKRLSR